MRKCSSPDATGDAECMVFDPNLICRKLIADAPAMCAPRCDANIPCQTGGTCDPASGRCM